jgi:hypothetical protein
LRPAFESKFDALATGPVTATAAAATSASRIRVAWLSPKSKPALAIRFAAWGGTSP